MASVKASSASPTTFGLYYLANTWHLPTKSWTLFAAQRERLVEGQAGRLASNHSYQAWPLALLGRSITQQCDALEMAVEYGNPYRKYLNHASTRLSTRGPCSVGQCEKGRKD